MPEKMDQDSSPSVKLLRVFRKLLLNGQRHYQTDLACEFQCSAQTIIRIMADIESVIGANLEYGLDNRRKWYRISSPSPKLLGLEFEELRYLSVCRDLAAQTLPEQILSRVDDTIFNLSVQMAERGTQETASQKESLITFFSKGRIDYRAAFPFIEKLLTAIDQRRVCLVRYKAASAHTAKEHRFAPHRLISMNQALYAVGDTLAKDYATVRHFLNIAIHRIQHVVLTDKTFSIDFPKVDGGNFGLPWHEPRTFRIHFKAGKAADYVSERIWSDSQKIEKQDDGSVILQITTSSEPELMAWVRSFGEAAKLLSPHNDGLPLL